MESQQQQQLETDGPNVLGMPSRLSRFAENPFAASGIGLAYAAILITLGLLLHVSGDAASETDFFDNYVEQARLFLAGDVSVDPYRGPVYPIILALLSVVLSGLGAGMFETGIVLSALSAGIAIWMLYQTLRSLFSGGFALLSVVIVATNPVFVRYAYTAGNDMFFVALATVSVYLFLRMKNPGRLGLVLTAAGVAAAYLTRYTGIAVLIAMVIAIVIVNVWRQKWSSRLVSALVLVGVFIVLIAPWAIYSKQQTGKFFYNKNYINIALGVYSTKGDSDRFFRKNPNTFTSFVDVVAYDPAKFLVTLPERTFRHLNTMVFRVTQLPIGAIAVMGVLMLLIRPPGRREVAFYLFGMTYLGVVLLVFYSDRFFLFLIPIVVVLAVRGLVDFFEIARSKRRGRVGVAIVLAVLLANNLLASVLYNRIHIRGETTDLRDLGTDFVRASGGAGGKVVARLPHFAYYAGLEHVRLPLLDTYDELLAFMREARADYLFFGTAAVRTRRELGELMNPDKDHPGLRVVAAGSFGVLYAVDKQKAP